MLEVIKQISRSLLLLGAGLLAVGCGGGGEGSGGGDPPPPNSSSSRVMVGPAAPRGYAQVVIDDAGNVLAVWQTQIVPSTTRSWSRAAGASWTDPRPLPESPSSARPMLRGAKDGQGVLYNGDMEVARFTGTDWVTVPVVRGNFADYGALNDPLLDDGTFPALTYASGVLRVVTQHGTEPWVTRADVSAVPYPPGTALAVSRSDPKGSSVRAIWTQGETVNGETTVRLRLATVDLESAQVSPPVTLTQGSDSASCASTRISAATGGNVTVISRPSVVRDVGGCNLLLTRYDHLTANDQTDQLNASGYHLSTRPVLITDGRGSSLLIWEEDQGLRSVHRARWSQSLEGGSWSPPQPLPFPIGLGEISVSTASAAMNAAGQIVFAALVGRSDAVDRSAIRARFSFTSGWSDWSVISGTAASNVDVAINSNGDAIAIYEEAANIYAVRF